MEGEATQALLESITTIITNLQSQNGVSAFLESVDLKKDNVIRFVAWLNALQIIPISPNAILESFESHADRYRTLVREKFDVQPVPHDDCSLIEMDVRRGMHIARAHSQTLGLSDDQLSFCELHCQRILTILSRSSPKFSYTQGFDRFASIAYLISLNFALAVGQDASFAEPLAYFLTEQLLTLSSAACMLDAGGSVLKGHASLDHRIKDLYPELWASLKEANHSSIHFAFRWKILMFADEHDLTSLFLIWDQLIAHRRQYSRYMEALCLAHIGQVPVEPDVFMVDRLQNFKQWDVPKLIADANRLSHPDAIVGTKTLVVVAAAIVAVAGIAFFVHRRREERRK